MSHSQAVIHVQVRRLKAHPANRQIYGDEGVADLVESIRESGVREPLAITKASLILSGHRRWRAAKKLRLKTVPARIVDGFQTDEDRIEALLLFNQHRAKTHEQLVREGLKWFDIEAARAERRQKRGKAADLGADLPEGRGRTRDKVARRTGIGGGRTFEKGREAVALIDELAGKGRTVEAEGLRRLLDGSYHAGFNAVRRFRREPRRTLSLLKLVGVGEADDLYEAQRVRILQQHSRVPKNLPEATDRFRIHCGDLLSVGKRIRKQLLSERRRTILTDPPYTTKPYGNGDADTFREAYRKLAEFTAEYLPRGGCLFAMAGTYRLPEAFDILRAQPGLSYYWTICSHQPGRSSKQQWRVVNTNWKPLLWFVKGRPSDFRGRKMNDYVRGVPISKAEHEWQQSPTAFEFIISHMTRPGDLVIDPFAGTATTGVVALRLGRRFVGIEIDKGIFHRAAKRLNDAARALDEGAASQIPLDS